MSILIKMLVWIGLKNRNKFIRTLAKIEYGNAIFCGKLSSVAINENRTELADLLLKHGKEENKHGVMLATLADGCNYMRRSGNGRWLEILRGGQNIVNPEWSRRVKSFIGASDTPKILQWNSTKYPGEQLTGTLESFDGMSKRYFCARLLFKNIIASDYSWEDKLAFMCVLEEEVAIFYQELIGVKDKEISAIASLITGDEFNHANYLKVALSRFTPFPDELIKKWRDRVWWAKWGLIIDAVKIVSIN